MTLKDWINEAKDEGKQIEKEMEENRNYVTMKDGENQVIVNLGEKPTKFQDAFGKFKYRFINTDGKHWDVTGKLYSEIVPKLADLPKDCEKAMFTVNRSGEGLQTRYVLVAVKAFLGKNKEEAPASS